MRVATATQQARPGHDAHGFLRHLFEMALAMVAGMMVSAAIFLNAVGMTAAEAMREHAVLFVVLQAFGMAVAMITWMRHRRHTWRSSSEMAAAMCFLPSRSSACVSRSHLNQRRSHEFCNTGTDEARRRRSLRRPRGLEGGGGRCSPAGAGRGPR